MSGTDPTVLTDGQLMLMAADVLEIHAATLFVDRIAGAAFIAEMRKRSPATERATRSALPCMAWCGEHWRDLQMRPIPLHWPGLGALNSFCYCTEECADHGGPMAPPARAS